MSIDGMEGGREGFYIIQFCAMMMILVGFEDLAYTEARVNKFVCGDRNPVGVCNSLPSSDFLFDELGFYPERCCLNPPANAFELMKREDVAE